MELIQLNKDDADIFIGFAQSRIGGRSENQDSYGSAKTGRGFLVTVCDGMGGGPGGKTASSIAVQEIITGVQEASDDDEIPNMLIKAIRRANLKIIETANASAESEISLLGMGTTTTVLLINEDAAYAAHVGDSRIYQIRGNNKVFRTFDHSMVFDLVKQKVITEEQARLSAQSNIITRALGIQPDVEVDVEVLPYQKGDRFVLTTDGIHGSMPEQKLIKMIANKKSALGSVTDDIATYADDLGREAGGTHDNLTIAIIETKNNSKLKPKMRMKTKLIILCLSLLCAASIAFNITQAMGSRENKAKAALADSLDKELNRKDSVHKVEIESLNSKLKIAEVKIKNIKEITNN